MLKEYVTRVSRDTVVYGFGNIVLSAISFFLVPIYTRIFSPGNYGVLEIVGTASSLLSTTLLLGMNRAVFRFYHDCDAAGKRELVSTGFWYQFLSPLAFCGLGALLARSISVLLFGSARYSPFLVVSLLTIPFNAMMRMPITVMRLNFRKIRYNLLVLGRGLFQTTLTIILVVFLRKGLMGVFVSALVSAVLFSAFGLFLTARHVRFSFSLKHFRLLLSFGVPIVPAALSHWIMGSADRFFLLRMGSLREVGLYSVGFKLAALQTFLLMAFQLAWSPIAYSMYRRPEADRVFRKFFLYFLLLSSALGVFLSLFSLEGLKILTRPAYYDGYRVVGILAFGRVLQGASYMGSMGIFFAKKTKYYALSVVCGASLNLLLNFLLVPPFGMMGAAVATASSYGAEACLGYYWARKLYSLRLPFHKVVILSAIYVPLLAGGLWVNRLSPEMAFLIKCLAFLVFLFAAAMLLEKDEKIILGRVAARIRRKLFAVIRRRV
jgi:O-antigen/teichoic acid export membrane protein